MSTKSLSVVSTQDAPSAIGPYSQAIKAGGFVFASGCIPLVPSTGEIVQGGVEEQTVGFTLPLKAKFNVIWVHQAQALANLKAVVTASGSEVGKVVKTTVFLKDMNDFATVNKVYADFFGSHKPARSAVEVARLPKDVLVEVECIAIAE
ncbi:hypothetical protein FRC09_011361 [Ceratobasidium sp. 395]|nr:hypothetical protein FRC09_011361 [Ceratobasidium sp. 395]